MPFVFISFFSVFLLNSMKKSSIEWFNIVYTSSTFKFCTHLPNTCTFSLSIILSKCIGHDLFFWQLRKNHEHSLLKFRITSWCVTLFSSLTSRKSLQYWTLTCLFILLFNLFILLFDSQKKKYATHVFWLI